MVPDLAIPEEDIESAMHFLLNDHEPSKALIGYCEKVYQAFGLSDDIFSDLSNVPLGVKKISLGYYKSRSLQKKTPKALYLQ
jgi:hypothetical protein